MFIHTRGSARKRFAKFGRLKWAFCGKKREKQLANLGQNVLALENIKKKSISAETLYHYI